MSHPQDTQQRVSVVLVNNPWYRTIPDDELGELLEKIAEVRDDHIQEQFANGGYDRDSLAVAIMDPNAPPSVPSEEALLATIAIGEYGGKHVVPAIAAAVYHRDFNKPAGFGVWLSPVQSGDGHPRRGVSTKVDDTIAGAHGLRRQDATREAGHVLVELNSFVIRQYFGMRNNDQRLDDYTGGNEPDDQIADMAAIPDIRGDDDDTSEHDAVA